MQVADVVLLAQNDGANAAVAMMVVMFYLVIIVLMVASLWVIFGKAGEPGWAAIVPIYNVIVLCRIAGKPEWWVLLFLIPCVNIVVSIILYIALAEKFGAGGGFAVGLILLPFIFFPLLAFGNYQYEGRSRRSSSRRRSRDYDDDEDDDYESRKPRNRRDDDEEDRPRRRRPRDDDDE